jgi:hypothetical protein
LRYFTVANFIKNELNQENFDSRNVTLYDVDDKFEDVIETEKTYLEENTSDAIFGEVYVYELKHIIKSRRVEFQVEVIPYNPAPEIKEESTVEI